MIHEAICEICCEVFTSPQPWGVSRKLNHHIRTVHMSEPEITIEQEPQETRMILEVPDAGISIRLDDPATGTLGTLVLTRGGMTFVGARRKRHNDLVQYDTLTKLMESGFLR